MCGTNRTTPTTAILGSEQSRTRRQALAASLRLGAVRKIPPNLSPAASGKTPGRPWRRPGRARHNKTADVISFPQLRQAETLETTSSSLSVSPPTGLPNLARDNGGTPFRERFHRQKIQRRRRQRGSLGETQTDLPWNWLKTRYIKGRQPVKWFTKSSAPTARHTARPRIKL